MASNESSSLSLLVERTQIKLKVRPDLRGALREEVEQWVAEAEELQFECPLDVDDLVREVKGAKEWLGSVGFLVSPEFLDVEMNTVPGPTASRGPSKEPEVVGDAVREPETSLIRSSVEDSAPVVEPIAAPPESLQPSAIVQPVGTKRRPMFLSSEDEGEDAPTPKKPRKEHAQSPMPEIVAVEPNPAHRRKGQANAQVTESDKIPQSVAKHGYPEHVYLLGWLIYNGHELLTRPAKCGQCLHYGHTCSGEAGKMCGRCIHDRQGCVAAEEYVAKDEKDGREPEAKERGSKGKGKGKAKDKGLTMGLSSISSKGVLDTPEGTRTSTLAGEEKMEELVERSEDLMRNVSVKLNDLLVKLSALNGAVLEVLS
ncbi:hypothetical protein JB92DRAFT_2838296 [Gautieria morchelliformis]|nr:hypothetical protein JB92DRAFT_2838296 [Gautieria morchelliformis]